MLTLTRYQGKIPDGYHALALPEVQHLLQRIPPSLVAIGASSEGLPLGLILANARDGHSANLLSLVVSEDNRRKGIGKGLWQALGRILQRKGVTRVFCEFLTEAATPSVEAFFLTSCGFEQPKPGIHIWSGPLHVIDDLTWMNSCKVSSDFIIAKWASLTPLERKSLENGKGNWYPAILSPFIEEDLIDPHRSLLLRHRGEVVGWMMLEPFDADTMLFKTMHVHHRHQRMGRGIALIVEACKRLIAEKRFQNGIFFVEEENDAMVPFMQRRLSHQEIRKQVLWRTQHLLGSDVQEQTVINSFTS